MYTAKGQLDAGVLLKQYSPLVRRLAVTWCVLAPAFVAYARLYRGAHHVTDILFGILNGVVCAVLAWLYLRRKAAVTADR